MCTYFNEDEEDLPMASIGRPATHNHGHTSQLSRRPFPPEIVPWNRYMEDVAAEAWNSLCGSLATHKCVGAAVAPPPAGSLDDDMEVEDQGAQSVAGDTCLGKAVAIAMQDQNSRVMASHHDRSMARMHRLCDQAGSPRHLSDTIIAQLREETLQNGFDPCHSSITPRDA